MTDLGDLIGRVELGDQPATVPLDLFLKLGAELETARTEIERLTAEQDQAKDQCVYLNGKRLDAIEERDAARDEIERLDAALTVRTRRLVTARADLQQATTERDNACAELARVQKLLTRAEGGTR